MQSDEGSLTWTLPAVDSSMASFARTVARSWLRLRVNLATAAICESTTTGSENHHERESKGVDMQVLICAEKSVDHRITLEVVFSFCLVGRGINVLMADMGK